MTNHTLHGSWQSLELQSFDFTVQVLHVWFVLAASVSIAIRLNTSKPTLQRVLEGGVHAALGQQRLLFERAVAQPLPFRDEVTLVTRLWAVGSHEARVGLTLALLLPDAAVRVEVRAHEFGRR